MSMQTTTGHLFDLWLWPLAATKFSHDYVEAVGAAFKVVPVRLGLIAQAASEPASAHHRELGRMVTEKMEVARRSGDAAAKAMQVVKTASDTNARMAGKLAAGRLPWPDEWFGVAERNLAAAAALIALPASMLAPVHQVVTRNARRLEAR